MKIPSSLIQSVQEALHRLFVPGWLFYGFQRIDPLALRILGFPEDAHISRRWFYLVPDRGEPRKLVHRIEAFQLDHLPGSQRVYLRWGELKSELARLLRGHDRVAMQYSPECGIPYVSRIDAGTVELVRSTGVEVISSGDLIQLFEAVLTAQQAEQHRETAGELTEIVNDTFQDTAEKIQSGRSLLEYEVQQSILSAFENHGLVCDHAPIVAVNGHSGNPHYCPPVEGSGRISSGDFLLIDLWARPAAGVYADITWTGFFGPTVPGPIEQAFDIVRRARDRGVEFLDETLALGREVQGWQVDDQVRAVIEEAGFGDFFVHRTGHNIGREVHGNGVNFDNLESHDTRKVIPGVLCSLEPGIYLEDFGVRTEINVLAGETGVEVTTPPQERVLVFDV